MIAELAFVSFGSAPRLSEDRTAHIATAIHDAPTVLIAIVSLVVLLRWRINSFWIVLLGANVGALAR